MAIRCRFVDSIASSPTVRLDLNDTTGAGFWLGAGGLDAPPPTLRRAEASTILRDGGIVAASAYDNRTVTLPVTITSAASMDARNTLVSSLVRELNRESNILEYRADGSSTSYFFRTFRSPELEQVMWLAKQPEATVSLSLLAEPFAYGLRVDQSPVTVKTDVSQTNGGYLDVNGVTGDVETPLLLSVTGGTYATATQLPTYLAVRRRGIPANLEWVVEISNSANWINGTDTAAAAVNDPTATGAGANNTAVTTFTSSALDPRVTVIYSGAGTDHTEVRGTYRVLARVKKSVSGDTIALKAHTNSLVTLASGLNWQLVDLGLVQFPNGPDSQIGFSGLAPDITSTSYPAIYGQRTSGAGNLIWDYVLLLPADENLAVIKSLTSAAAAWAAPNVVVFDGPNDTIYKYTSSRLSSAGLSYAGSLPTLRPGNNRVYWIEGGGDGTNTAPVTATSSLTPSYWPRFLTV